MQTAINEEIVEEVIDMKEAIAENEAKAEPEIGEMKRGDYMIHVYVEKAKEMMSSTSQDKVDPLIEVSCLGQKKYTKHLSSVGQLSEVTWAEHVFLEPKNVEKHEAEEGRIVIRLLDKHFLKDSVIGVFEFDLTHIYFMENHLMLHQWMALSNPNSEKYSQITGYLKCSISVICTGDKQVQITEDEGIEEVDNVLMPPQLNPKFYQIIIRIFQAQNIPPMDDKTVFSEAKTDAYIKTVYKKRTLKTKTLEMDRFGTPVKWNQEFLIPAQWPIISGRLVLQVMDKDPITDETVGSIIFDMNDIISGKYQDQFIWKNIYGSPMGQSNSIHKKEMNNNPEVASWWKGRVLLEVLCEETPTPVVKRRDIKREVIKNVSDHFKSLQGFEVIAQVGQGINLPSNQKYRVQINIGGYNMITSVPEVGNFKDKNYLRWNQQFEQFLIKDVPYTSVGDFETILISLIDEKNKPVCFFKDSVFNYLNPDAQFNWVSLNPDKCVGKVKEVNNAGLISFKMSINDIAANGNIKFLEYESWSKPPKKRANHIRIRAYIYQCKDLPAADSDGTSDPYIKVWDLSETQRKTQVINDNLNPLFYEVMELEYEVRDVDDLSSYPPLIFDVWDEDAGRLNTDDYLGRAIIYPSDSAVTVQRVFDTCSKHQEEMCPHCTDERTEREIPKVPRWHPFRFSPQDPVAGEVLVSFTQTELDYRYMFEPQRVDLKKRVKVERFEVNMLILGLRNLQSPGFLPVKKAFVSFNLKSLVPPDSSAIQNIKTQPKASGANPTINTSIEFEIPLPVDTLYCPKLTCTVFDYIFKGWNQPMIGVFNIPIGELMINLKKTRQQDLEDIEKVIDALDEIMKDSHHNYQIKDFKRAFQKELLPSSSLNQSSDQINSRTDSLPGQIFKNIKQAGIKNALKKTYEKMPSEAENFDASEMQGVYHAHEAYNDQIDQILDQQKKLRSVTKYEKQVGMSGLSMSSYQKGDGQFDNTLEQAQKTKMQAIQEEEQLKAEVQRIQENERKRAMENLIEEGNQAFEIVIIPKYKMDERLKVEVEDKEPPEIMFLGLGWHRYDNCSKGHQMRYLTSQESSIQCTKCRENIKIDEGHYFCPTDFEYYHDLCAPHNQAYPEGTGMIHDKHYRQYYNNELENVNEIFTKSSPFNSFSLKRGQIRGLKKGGLASLFRHRKQEESGQISSETVVGIFKGIIEIESEQDKKQYQIRKKELVEELIHKLQAISMAQTKKSIEINPQKLGSVMERKQFETQMRELNLSRLNISHHLQNLESDEILKRSLLSHTKCLVRLYMIKAQQLSTRDNDSPSDPYLVIKCNNKTYNERDKFQLDEPNPKFNEHYDFEATFPGCTPITIDVYDWDQIFGDDLIGSTFIDLEDRYFSMQWQALREKPIECRQIYHQSSSISQGCIYLWSEINQLATPGGEIKLWDITDEPPVELEVRICVLNAKNVEIMDVEGTSDVYFRGMFSQKDVQETDTHYRNQDGKPDFQYRFVFRVQASNSAKDKDFKFNLQAYDRDMFSSNELIGEATIKLKNIINDCKLIKRPIGFDKKYYKDLLDRNQMVYMDELKFDKDDDRRFWLPMKYQNVNSKKKKEKEQSTRGQVQIQIDVLTAEQADANPVGKARQEPNHSPMLPVPEGRISLSINPFKMYQQMIGPAMRRKIHMLLCCILCLVTFIMILPNIAGTILIKEWDWFTSKIGNLF